MEYDSLERLLLQKYTFIDETHPVFYSNSIYYIVYFWIDLILLVFNCVSLELNSSNFHHILRTTEWCIFYLGDIFVSYVSLQYKLQRVLWERVVVINYVVYIGKTIPSIHTAMSSSFIILNLTCCHTKP